MSGLYPLANMSDIISLWVFVFIFCSINVFILFAFFMAFALLIFEGIGKFFTVKNTFIISAPTFFLIKLLAICDGSNLDVCPNTICVFISANGGGGATGLLGLLGGGLD